MKNKLVQQPPLTDSKALTLIIGLSSRNLLGFFYMWTNIFGFILHTKKAEGCLHTCAGISSPIAIQLISYWDSEDALMKFVKSKAHVSWVRFIYRHPRSLNLFNETYRAPYRANYINKPVGFSAVANTTQNEYGESELRRNA